MSFCFQLLVLTKYISLFLPNLPPLFTPNTFLNNLGNENLHEVVLLFHRLLFESAMMHYWSRSLSRSIRWRYWVSLYQTFIRSKFFSAMRVVTRGLRIFFRAIISMVLAFVGKVISGGLNSSPLSSTMTPISGRPIIPNLTFYALFTSSGKGVSCLHLFAMKNISFSTKTFYSTIKGG